MGWYQLVDMIQEGRDIDAQDGTAAPTSCAACYTPLKAGVGGSLFCPWEGLRWPEDASAWGEFPGSF